MLNKERGCPCLVELFARDSTSKANGSGKLVEDCIPEKVSLMAGLKQFP
jgi:hypothetical protein